MEDKKDEIALRVGDAMTKGVITIDENRTVQEAAEVLKKNDISSLVVMDGKSGVGVVTERDIICKVVAEFKDPRETSVKDIMTSPIITIHPSADIDEAARKMRDRDVRRLVVSRDDKIIGILTEFDIVRVEPAMHTLIREKSSWSISESAAVGEGMISGICDECENYSEKLRSRDGVMLCEDCYGE